MSTWSKALVEMKEGTAATWDPVARIFSCRSSRSTCIHLTTLPARRRGAFGSRSPRLDGLPLTSVQFRR